MSIAVADLFVVLDSVTDPFSAGMKKAAADAEASSGRMGSALATVAKVGIGLGVAVAGIAVESVKMASTFNAQMTLLQTQAGVGKNQMAGLTSGVLALAGQVGFSPTSLSEALFHVESSFASVGITGPQALSLLKIAAEGAAVGHANLVDVTNALDSAVVSGIPGVQDMNQAMGVLNATVGSGDMTMQDLANSFSTGLLATVKGYGLTFKDVGAGLAVFGDNNIRGAVAATDLRMAVQAMAVPASGASTELKKLGLSSTTLAQDMQQGGMLQALEDLKTHMQDAGVTTKEQGQVITELFGKKAGTGLNVLIDQLDRVKSKYPDLTAGANGFADAWIATKGTFAQQMKEIGAEADALGIRLGNFLLPHLSTIISAGQSDLGQLVSGFTGAATKPVAHDNLHNALLNQEAAAPPPLTGWQKFGQELHTIVGDVESFGQRLEPVGKDFLTFGLDAYQAVTKLAVAVGPTVKLLGEGLFGAIVLVGKTLANVAGPALRGFADFLSNHQGAIKFFAEVILGGLALKMATLGTINAVQGIVGLATSIAQFPLKQAGDITAAIDGVKTAWSGKAAAEGEAAVTGLKGAFNDLKTSAGNLLDKFSLFNGSNMSGLAKIGEDMGSVEQVAAKAPEQLGLFETSMTGIVQVAEQGPEQLSLFEAGEVGVAQQAETAATSAESLAGKIGKFALAGGVIGGVVLGVGLLAVELGKLAGSGDHTGQSMDQLATQLKLASSGSAQARDQFTQAATAMVDMSVMVHKPVQGLTDIDKSLAQLVTSGHAQDAKTQFDDIAASLAKQGISAQTAASKFPAYEQAIKNAGDAAQTTDGQLSGMQATLAAQQALTGFNSDLQSLTQQLKSSGNSMDSNSQSGLQNQQMFSTLAGDVLNYYQQQRTAGVGTDDATKTMVQQEQQIEALGQQFGISKGTVDGFLGSLAAIKPSYSTTVNVNTAPAVQAINGLIQRIDNSTGTVQVYASSSGAAGGRALSPYDDGGFIPGPKGAPRVILAHGGEYVVSNDMQSGRRSMDPRVLAGVSSGGPGSAGPGGGAAMVVNHYTYNLNVAGSVVAQQRLVDVLRTEVLQYKGRNSTNGWG